MKNQIRKLIAALLVVLLAVGAVIILEYTGIINTSGNSKSKGELKVHFIDVGQGNAALLEIDGHYALIDGGDASAANKVTSYLESVGVEKLDYVIATHYDTDHIYGLVNVVYRFDVKKVLAPNYVVDTKIYRSFRNSLKIKGITSRQPQVGEKIDFQGVTLLCVAPADVKFQNENDYSIGMKIIYDNISFLICGDATYRSEIEMLESGIDLDSDVYLVSHHGSSTSSTTRFLEAVTPRISIISVGADNTYGHPTRKVLKRLKMAETDVFRTDILGDIIMKTDGDDLSLHCRGVRDFMDENSKPYDYVVNTRTGNFHIPGCESIDDMSEHNKLFFAGTKEQLLKMGYTSCVKCTP